MNTTQSAQKRRLIGVVINNNMDKTVNVLVERKVLHKKYKKFIKRRKKYLAHDQDNICGIGDKVMLIESRPLSKRKSFKVLKILQKAL